MKIKQIGALLGGAVLMALAGSAGAGTLYNGTTVANNGVPNGYNVSVYEDSIFNFHVNSITSNNPSAINVNKVTVVFFTKPNDQGKIVSGFTTLNAGTDAGGTNWGASHTVNAAGMKFEYFQGANANAIQGAGGNMFAQQNGPNVHSPMGYFVLNSPTAKSMEVILQLVGPGGSKGYYVDTFNLTDFSTPEASSLALLLPGLVPLGIALRRRRAARV